LPEILDADVDLGMREVGVRLEAVLAEEHRLGSGLAVPSRRVGVGNADSLAVELGAKLGE